MKIEIIKEDLEFKKDQKLKKGDKFKKGDKVTWKYAKKSEQGIFLRYAGREGESYVVFKCGGDWDNFKLYTAESCFTHNLTKGWN